MADDPRTQAAVGYHFNLVGKSEFGQYQLWASYLAGGSGDISAKGPCSPLRGGASSSAGIAGYPLDMWRPRPCSACRTTW
jgi:hypothetical protein